MTDPVAQAKRVAEMDASDPARVTTDILAGDRPMVLRGLAGAWPSVAFGRQGPAATAAYLRRFDSGRPMGIFAGPPTIGGRFFYRDDMHGFNFDRGQVLLGPLLDALLAEADSPTPPALYAGANAAPDHFPGWMQDNPLPLAIPAATPRLWLGNATRVSTHYDMSANIAVVVAGRRRFAIFPPDQVGNLYVGPLETTMAGQPSSMVDLEHPDLDRHPRFAAALATMQVAELEPGDALFMPPLWWHDVRASGPLNVLVNYWWGEREGGSAFPALIHALLTVRDLPPAERQAVKAWFDHYIFDDDPAAAGAHLLPHARGILGPPTPERTGMIQGFLKRTFGG